MAPVETQKSRRNKLVNLTHDNNCREFSFKKRKSTLKKKAAELSTLCDVNVCMVCFGPDQTVETWPENKWDVHDLIFKYEGISDKAREKGKQKNKKVDKKKRKNNENNNTGRAVSTWDERLNLLSDEGLLGLCSSLHSKLQELGEKIRILQMKEKKATEIMNGEVRLESNNLNYDLRRFNGDYFLNQQVDVANWPSKYHDNMNSRILGWSNNFDFGRPDNLAFFDENCNNNRMDMVNFGNNFAFDKYSSLGFVHTATGLETHEERIGLIGESSNGNSYFQSHDPHCMFLHTSPTSPLQEALSISVRPSSHPHISQPI